ncbi:MAG TPA: hypothetical protein VH597_03280 [Verrucomicrobiae bacterium]|jgi:hypothetical protein|nr:hypothetical protein [Verrucomicrobiae bacterium]
MKLLGNKARLTAVLVIILFFGVVFAQPSFPAPTSTTNSAVLLHELTSLTPDSETNLAELMRIANLTAKNDKKESKAEKKLARRSEDLKNLPTAELRKRFTDDSLKYETRAVGTIGRLAQEALQASDGTRSEREREILEVQASLSGEHAPLVPEKLGIISTWVYFFKNMPGSIGRGSAPAANVKMEGTIDDGRTDPLPSSFWTRPTAISNEDLYAGFGRKELPHLEKSLCNYDAPKVSSGTHAGFDVESDGQRFKIKFGELNSEAFTARIFHALGYHVDPTDYAPEVRIRYDRRMLRELHLRKPLSMKITPLGIRICTLQFQTHYDPFTFITYAVFKDGRKISGADLKQTLFLNPNVSHPEDSLENFRQEVEAELDYVVMAPANVQPRDTPTQSIGSWEFGGLGHENLRELRGAGLLAAWLAWFDSRADNTKLRVVRDADDVQLQHFISDLGGGLGAGTGLFSAQGENPNELAWTFTAPEIVRGPGRMTTPFRIEHFRPTVPTPAFAAMTMNDARWMARLIGQLTENQIRGALIASGYDSAEARLYLEKLISRRDRMICDLKLQNEIPLIRPNRPNHKFNYTPSADGPFVVTDSTGAKVFARESSQVISQGKISHR